MCYTYHRLNCYYFYCLKKQLRPNSLSFVRRVERYKMALSTFNNLQTLALNGSYISAAVLARLSEALNGSLLNFSILYIVHGPIDTITTTESWKLLKATCPLMGVDFKLGKTLSV